MIIQLEAWEKNSKKAYHIKFICEVELLSLDQSILLKIINLFPIHFAFFIVMFL
jgi:hypothetical protein